MFEVGPWLYMVSALEIWLSFYCETNTNFCFASSQGRLRKIANNEANKIIFNGMESEKSKEIYIPFSSYHNLMLKA